jgi:autotransporter translocation and assembly factor TamB
LSPRRRWLGWLGRGLSLCAALLVAGVLALLLPFGTGWGRARALDALLTQVNQKIPGRLEVGTLERLGPGGATLLDVRLRDPAGAVVLELGSFSAAINALELLHGRIVLPRVALARGRIDLTELDGRGRGLLAALVDPDAPPSPPDPSPPPYVRVDEIALEGLDLQAPELPPPWSGVSIRGLAATARFELDGAPELVLASLSCELQRGGRPLARVERSEGLLAGPGRASELSLALAFGSARTRLRARGVLPPAQEHATAPLAAELHVEGLTAHDLGELLADATLAEAFVGPITLDLALDPEATVTLDRLSLRGALTTAAGKVELSAALRERRSIELGVATDGLVLSRVRPDLPSAPLSLVLHAATDISDAPRLPIVLRAAPGRFGPFALPALDARGTWNGQSVRSLSLSLEQGQSRLSVRGTVDGAGSFDVHVGAAVVTAELRALATAAGLSAPICTSCPTSVPGSPAPAARVRGAANPAQRGTSAFGTASTSGERAALNADLRVQRTLDGRLSMTGDVRAEGVRSTDLSLDSARVELALAGPPQALEGRADVRVRGLSRGSTRVPRADLVVLAGRGGYRVRGRADVDRSSLELDVSARPAADHWSLEGSARGRWEQRPFALQLGRTAISPQGWFTTRGIDLEASGQALHITGSVGRPRSELSVSAPALDLGALARLAGLGDGWRGRAALELRLRGRLQAPALELTLDARDVARRDAPALSARIEARLDAAAGQASLDATLGSGAPGWIDASFALASEFRPGPGWEGGLEDARQRASLALRQLELRALERWLDRPIPVSVQLGLSASLEGTLREPVLHAEVQAALAEALGLPALQIEHRLDYAAGTLTTTLDVDDARGRWLSLGSELELAPGDAKDVLALPALASELGARARWSLRLDAARRRVGALWADAPAAAAGLELDARVRLDHDPGAEPSGHASVHVSEARLPTAPAGCSASGVELALDATLADRKLEVALNASQGRTQLLTATATASVELAPALRGGAASLGSVASELTSRGLDLGTVPFLCGRVRGRLDAKVTLADALGVEPSLDARLQATGLSLGAEPSLGLELSLRADRALAQAAASIAGPRGTSRLSARLPIRWSSGRLAVASDAPVSARAQLVALPIAPLLDPAGAVSYATGWLSGSVDVGGTVAEPEPSGSLELADAELTATALAQPLHGVRGRVSFDRKALAIEHFEARDRDGELALSGRVDRRGDQALDVTLDVKAKRFPLRQRGQIVATTSGHAKIHAAIEPARSSVAVKLVDADTWLEKAQARTGIDLAAHPDFVVAGAAASGSAASDRTATPGAPAAAPPAADPARESHVRLDASDRFWIKRDDFAIQLSTRLDAVITGDQAKVTGKVDINRGYLDLMGRVFDVTRGSRLEFTGTSKPDPVVDIGATYEHRGSGKTVKVQISGRGSKPVLTFFIDDGEVSAGEVLELLLGRRGSGGEDSAKKEATSFVSALTAGLLATSARRELGAAAPIIMIEPGDQTGDGRIRAGFELDALVPRALQQLITGIYVEGIVEREGANASRGQSQEGSTQAGVLLELYFPHQLFSTGQWGPGTTWSLDWGWQL